MADFDLDTFGNKKRRPVWPGSSFGSCTESVSVKWLPPNGLDGRRCVSTSLQVSKVRSRSVAVVVVYEGDDCSNYGQQIFQFQVHECRVLVLSSSRRLLNLINTTT